MQYKPIMCQKTIIVDIDETLSHLNGRGYHDWSTVFEDTVDETVLELVRLYARSHSIVLITGRSEVCREDTVRWLDKYNVPFDYLYMKGAGDHTDSAITKETAMKDFVAKNPTCEIVLAIDDRQKIIDMWKDNGIRTLMV